MYIIILVQLQYIITDRIPPPDTEELPPTQPTDEQPPFDEQSPCEDEGGYKYIIYTHSRRING